MPANRREVPPTKLQFLTAAFGLSAVVLFGTALAIFSSRTPGFSHIHDVVSLLGAMGQPQAMWWNLIGFLAVGILLTAFGASYGVLIRDRIVGLLLSLFGVGFSATSIPVDMGDASAPVSKLHVVAICCGLAAWFFALARLAQKSQLGKSVRRTANVAATLVVLPMVGQVLDLWPMPVTHRLVFLVVFGWLALTCLLLLRSAAAAAQRADLRRC